MSERFSSGDRHLDAVLGGGLPANALNMIIGLPGSGKTILAEQFMFHNASPERPGVYLSTVSEPLEKILRYGQSLHFFDAEAIGTSVFFEDLGPTLNDGGLDAVLPHLRVLITQRRPGMIAIDSFKALSAYAATRERSASSCMSSPAISRPSPRPRSGSASTVETKSRPPRNSRSLTESSRSPHVAKPNARSATSRFSNFAARDSCQVSTPTGSPPTACMSFRGSRKACP